MYEKYQYMIIKNKQLTINTFIKAKDYLEKDFKPLDDMRASKEYRLEVAKNLLIKCFIEINNNNPDAVIETIKNIGGTFGGINYYLGPVNTVNSPNWNIDHMNLGKASGESIQRIIG